MIPREEQEAIVKKAIVTLIAVHRVEFEALINKGRKEFNDKC